MPRRVLPGGRGRLRSWPPYSSFADAGSKLWDFAVFRRLALGLCLVQTGAVVSFYVFLLIVGAIGALAYLALFMSHVPGAADERLGTLEPLPEKLNEWVEDQAQSADGLVCERRHLMSEPSSGKMI